MKGDLVVVSTFGGWAVLQMTATGKDEVTVKELKRHDGKDLSNYWGGMVPVGDYIYFAHTQAHQKDTSPFRRCALVGTVRLSGWRRTHRVEERIRLAAFMPMGCSTFSTKMV